MIVAEHDRRVEKLLADAEAACGPVAWPRVEALITALVELYGVGLERMLDSARATANDVTDLDRRLVADEVIASLLLLHDLHPNPSPHVLAELRSAGTHNPTPPPETTLIPADRLVRRREGASGGGE